MKYGKSRISFGSLFVVFGLLLYVFPRYLLPVCTFKDMMVETASGARIPMKCHYAMTGLTVLAFLAAGLGVLFFFARRRESRVLLSIMGALMSLFTILTPLVLPGVCGDPKMPCRYGTLPGVVVLGAMGCIVALGALAAAFISGEDG